MNQYISFSTPEFPLICRAGVAISLTEIELLKADYNKTREALRAKLLEAYL